MSFENIWKWGNGRDLEDTIYDEEQKGDAIDEVIKKAKKAAKTTEQENALGKLGEIWKNNKNLSLKTSIWHAEIDEKIESNVKREKSKIEKEIERSPINELSPKIINDRLPEDVKRDLRNKIVERISEEREKEGKVLVEEADDIAENVIRGIKRIRNISTLRDKEEKLKEAKVETEAIKSAIISIEQKKKELLGEEVTIIQGLRERARSARSLDELDRVESQLEEGESRFLSVPKGKVAVSSTRAAIESRRQQIKAGESLEKVEE